MKIVWEWPFEKKSVRDFPLWQWSVGVMRYNDNIYIFLLVGTLCIELEKKVSLI